LRAFTLISPPYRLALLPYWYEFFSYANGGLRLKKKKAKRVQVIEQGGQLYELYR